MNALKIAGIVVLAFLYTVSPIDVAPDFIPILGWLDDIGVIGWAATTIKALNSLPLPPGSGSDSSVKP